MKVLHVLDYSPPFPGGMAVYLAALGERLRASGGELACAFPRARSWNEDLARSCRIVTLPSIRRPVRSGFAKVLREEVERSAFDLVQISFSFALPLALALDYHRAGVPVVYQWHNPPRALLGRSGGAARLPGAGRGWMLRALSGVAARLADRRVIDCHIVISREIRELLLAHRWTSAGKIELLPNPLPARVEAGAGRVGASGTAKALAETATPHDASVEQAGASQPAGKAHEPDVGERAGDEPAFRNQGPVIGSVANFRPQKDHTTLLRAFANLARSEPDARLVLVGDGPTRPAMEALAAELGLTARVEFTGFVQDTNEWYRRFDLFALSTRYEGQGIVLLEAMARGVPVVCTDLLSTREVVTDGQDGILVPPEDPARLAGAWERLLRDAELRRRLGTAGRERARTGYSLDGWTVGMERLYRQVLG